MNEKAPAALEGAHRGQIEKHYEPDPTTAHAQSW